MFRCCSRRDATSQTNRPGGLGRRGAGYLHSGSARSWPKWLTMGFSEFLGNERIVAALRGALRSGRVPHALLFTGPRGLGKFTLARMFAQAATCERLRDAYCQPMGRRRVFILDGAETMRWDVASVFLKILEEPPGSATLILTAPSPYALLPTIVSRCLQFHFAPLPQAAVEKILKERTDRKPAEIKLAAQLAEGSPGLAIEMDVDAASERRKNALRILERAAQGHGFAQLFSDTSALAKDRNSSFEDHIGVFYGLLTDLLELTSKVKEPVLRNAPLAKELESLAKSVDSGWVLRAIAGFDELYVGARRNLNRQLGFDALAASLAPAPSGASVTRS